MKNIAFERDIETIPSIFPKLYLIEEDGEKFLRGELDILDKEGILWDTYQVEIKGSQHYPYSFPKLFETGRAFPKILDWHVYEFDDKSCCVDVPPNEAILCKDGLHVKEYIQSLAIPYLANQSFRFREGYYLYGEYSHGIMGRIEFYQGKLKARSPAELVQMFEFILLGTTLKRTDFCPFCKKVKFRKCHRDVFKEFQFIRSFLKQDWGALKLFFAANPEYKLP